MNSTLTFALATACLVTSAVSPQDRPARRITVPALVGTIAFSPDGSRVIAWDPAGFSVWSLETGRLTAREAVFGKACGRVAVLPRSEDGATIAVPCKGRLIFFDAITGKLIGEWQLPEKQTAVAYTAQRDGSRAAAVIAGATSAIEVFGRSGSDAKVALKAQQEVEQMSFAPDGRRLAAGSFDGVEIFDLPAGQRLHALAGGPAHAFGPDGEAIAVVRGSGVGIFDASGKETRALDGGAAHVRFGPDGRHLAGWTNQQLIVWDTTSGAPRLTIKSDRFVTAALSPDGTRLATISMELRGDSASSTLSIWNLQ